MTITTDDVRKFATNAKMRTFANLFDEWLESHDAEVRMDAIIARDTRTPDELLQAAWEAAFPVPEGRIPSEVPYIARYEQTGGLMAFPTGKAGDMHPSHGVEYRTLAPLPPLIPEDCMAVWASLKGLGDPQNPTRCVWLRDSGRHSWRNSWNVVAAEVDLIDPKPVPEEER